jgi:diguanylate cyclase (GGDEF)-like protein/PAS domain S-box-containing protein
MAEQKVLRVGVYDNPPKLMLDQQGEPSGIFGDLIKEIAQRENWQLEAVPCHWNDCLLMLQQGKLDLMPDVAKTQSRQRIYHFHQLPALVSWSQVYTARKVQLTSLLDLDGKTMALLEGSAQQDYLQNLIRSFGLQVDWLLVDDLDKAFAAVVNGQADAVAASHYFGNFKTQSTSLNISPIVFQPSELFFASAKENQRNTLQLIDSYLQRWKQSENSVYHQILKKWSVSTDKNVPTFVWWFLAFLLVAMMVVVVFNRLLKQQIRVKSLELLETENRLSTILNGVDAYVYIKGRDYRYQFVNDKISDLTGLTPEQLIGDTDDRIFDRETVERVRQNDQRVMEQGIKLVEEEDIVVSSGDVHHFVSIKIPLRDKDDNVYALSGISTDITEQKRIQARLKTLEYSDPLTGLPNRFELFHRIENAMNAAPERPFDGALLVIDVDDFKIINEARNHRDGDQLLIQIAGRLRSYADETMKVARISSDEFACLLQIPPDHDSQDYAHHQAIELRQLLSSSYNLESGNYTATVSIGIALFVDAERQPERLLRLADLALNEAKRLGRNSQQFFDQPMQDAINRRSIVEVALRNAIDHDMLELYLQEQVNSQHEVIGMEALLRWHDQAMGPVSPSDFIPIAEDSGLIIPLGKWVIEKACEILSHWSMHADTADLTLAINISPRQFRHNDFVEHIDRVIKQSGIDPTRLKLEVTENLLIDNPEQVVTRMNKLRLLGVSFSLDDFGTGYASLSYLKLLPFHQLKIDQSFVRDLTHNSNDEAIIRTILALGRSLDLDVIAEGVETQAQMSRLKELGCFFFQGYLFARPTPAADYLVHRLSS